MWYGVDALPHVTSRMCDVCKKGLGSIGELVGNKIPPAFDLRNPGVPAVRRQVLIPAAASPIDLKRAGLECSSAPWVGWSPRATGATGIFLYVAHPGRPPACTYLKRHRRPLQSPIRRFDLVEASLLPAQEKNPPPRPEPQALSPRHFNEPYATWP
jgi:hypothetical protein